MTAGAPEQDPNRVLFAEWAGAVSPRPPADPQWLWCPIDGAPFMTCTHDPSTVSAQEGTP